MNSIRAFKQKLATVSRLWEANDYDAALAEVDQMLEKWPGNAHLHVLWSGLVQLQDDPKHSLDDAKEALHQAIGLDKNSPVGAIELGHFLDAIEDDPRAAVKAYSDGVAMARHLLIEGLMGQAKALLQLEKKDEARQCMWEVLHETQFEPGAERNKSDQTTPDILFGSPTGRVYGVQLKGPFADQIEELLSELFASRSASS